MIVNAKVVGRDELGNPVLVQKEVSDMQFNEECVMAVDGSTDITGVGIMRKIDGALLGCISFKREKMTENPVKFKVKMKQEVYKLLKNNRKMCKIFYEEPFIGYADAAKNLLMLRTFIEELIYENEPEFDYLKYSEINNMKWKSLFLSPTPCPAGTKLQKEAVREKLVGGLPFLSDITQDEVDAISMGYVAVMKIKTSSEDELKSQKKAKPFLFNSQFIGANSDDDLMCELENVDKIVPSKVLSNGIMLVELKGKGKWDENIYREMGGEDKLLIVKFPSNRYGNVILENRLGHLAEVYDYIYALVWRKSRKVVITE